MSIYIDTQIIHKSIAQVLAKVDPNATIFDNPNQQGTKLPAWFIVHSSPVSNVCQLYNRFFLTYNIDIYYMLEYNRPRLYDEYAAIADALDLAIDYLPIYGTDNQLVHVYERSWELAMNALKYSIVLHFRVTPDTDREPYMQVIQSLDVFLKEAFPMKHVFFENTTHPELNIQLPNRLITHFGGFVELPTVEGVYQDSKGKYWHPESWSIGAFGSEYGPLYNDVTTDLVLSDVTREAYCTSNADIEQAVLASNGTIQLYDSDGHAIPYNSEKTYTCVRAWGKLLGNDDIVEWPSALLDHLYITQRESNIYARCMSISYGGYDLYLSKVQYIEV